MKETLKHKAWKPIGIFLGNVALLDWVIFPGLTAANSFINMLSVAVFIAMFLFDIDFIKKEYFTKSEEEKALEAKWKADLEKKMKEVKRKSKAKVTIDVSGAKNMKEVSGIVNPIAEGRVKISVENPKPKRKSKTK